MSQEGTLIFGFVVGILFIAVGIFGISKKIKLAKRIQTMHELSGVIVDFKVGQTRDEHDYMRDVYSPIYEYEWNGIKKRLNSKVCVQKEPSIGKTVHILLNPMTGEAICMEDEQKSQGFLVIFGIIGIAVVILMILLKMGIV